MVTLVAIIEGATRICSRPRCNTRTAAHGEPPNKGTRVIGWDDLDKPGITLYSQICISCYEEMDVWIKEHSNV